MLTIPPLHSARSYAQALEGVRAMQDRDDDRILTEARTALYDCGRQTPLAVVLLHGFTNNPAQYLEFGPLLQSRGVNAFVPRLPKHGDRDRLTDRIASLTAQSLLDATAEALDLAAGLGERVGVLGISMGGTLAAYFAQHRELAVAVPVAPEFALLKLPYPLSRGLGWTLGVLPNFFVWWDPRVKIEQRPLSAYPRFSTRALAQTLRVGDDVYAASRRDPHRADRIATVISATDPAINNATARAVSDRWKRNGGRVEVIELTGLPPNHDIVDPANPLAQTADVYPALLDALGVPVTDAQSIG